MEVEYTLKDKSGIKLEIYKRREEDEALKNPSPDFPEDLTVSDTIDDKRTWLPWDPQGTNRVSLPKECGRESVRERVWGKPSAAAQGRVLTEWGQRCTAPLAHGVYRLSFLPLLRLAMMRYSFWGNPHIHHLKATLPDGRVLDGFIAMKPDALPRPFIISKCGLFCNAQQSTTHRLAMMHFFDESPFHVLSLANNTGSDFQKNNQSVALGGFDEGRQLYQIAQLVVSPESPVKDRISSVHVAGSSLGGAAALYAGLYASLNDPPGQTTVKSVTALCPVVVLDRSVKALYSTKPVSTFATFETLHQIRDIFNFVPIIGEYFPWNVRRMRTRLVYENLISAVFHYYQDWTTREPWDLKPFQGLTIDTLDQYWYANDFRNFVSQVTIPTLVISAKNDELVKAKLNSRPLAARLAARPNENVGTVILSRGNHCAFGLANGWANYSTILREYILSHTPEAPAHWKEVQVPLPPFRLELRSGERIVDAHWKAHAGREDLELEFKIFSPRRRLSHILCERQSPYYAQDYCYRRPSVRVPIRSLPFEVPLTPHTPYEVTSQTRFANVRFTVVDEKGGLLAGSRRSPRYVRAYVWQ